MATYYGPNKINTIVFFHARDLIEDYIDRNSFFGFFPYQNHKLKFWHVRQIDGNVAKVVFQDINTQEDIELEFRVDDSKVRGYK